MAMVRTLERPVAAPTDDETPGHAPRRRPREARFGPWSVPMLGSALFALVAVNYALWWNPVVHHVDAWWVPGDFWIDYFGTSALVHGHWSAMYAMHTGLDVPPGILVVLAPAVALGQLLHLSIGMPYTAVSTPTTWLLLEPFAVSSGCVALFATDALARRLTVPVHRRTILMGAEVFALWDLLVNQWHPEDALAVALALWGLLAAFDGRWRRSSWLLGVAIAFQPLVVLALAAVVAIAPRRSSLGLVIRAAIPPVVVLAGPLLANPGDTVRAVLTQPGYPLVDHPTPWTSLAPHLSGGAVAAGPVRLVAVALAVVMSWVVCRRTQRLAVVVWTVALCFATRSVFESVMVAYYIWPTLAVALVVAARAHWTRFASACVLSSFVTAFALSGWRGEWAWWSIVIGSIGAVLVAAWPRATGAAPGSPAAETPSSTDTLVVADS